MGVKHFAILTGDSKPFRGDHSPGQAVSGMVRVTIEGEEPKRCRGVRLDMSGEGRVEWGGNEEGAETYVNYRYKQSSVYSMSMIWLDKTHYQLVYLVSP